MLTVTTSGQDQGDKKLVYKVMLFKNTIEITLLTQCLLNVARILT